MKIRFFPYDFTYKVIEEKPFVEIFGRSDNGQICVLDPFEPYFIVVGGDYRIEGLKQEDFFVTRVEDVSMKLNETPIKAMKVFVNVPKGVPVIAELCRERGFNCFEFDILFVRRYLVDKGFMPMTLLEADVETFAETSRVPVYIASKIVQVDEVAKPKMLALDIEVYNPEGKSMDAERFPIIMLSLYGENFSKVLTWKKTDAENVEVVASESELIERFKHYLLQYSPDLLVTYFGDGFDLPYIKARADKYKIRLDLGLDHSEMRLSSRGDSTAEIRGIVHFDVSKFVRRVIGSSIDVETFDLDSVAQALIGAKKHEVDLDNLAPAWDSGNIKEFCIYNLQDSKLCYDLAVNLFPNILELSRIVGLPLFDVNRMGFSQLVEWYIIRQAKVYGEIILNKPGYQEENSRFTDRVKGALVYTPKPGLYENIVVFDFRSLYPSIIASHNISPGMLNCKCCEGKNSISTQRGKFWFCQKKGFLSAIIADIISRRARIKDMLKKNKDPLLAGRVYGLKILSNAFYGYLGFAPARWYCIECAESTTAWARYYITKVIDSAKEKGFDVLYSDTDSIFLTLGKRTVDDALKFVEQINLSLPELMELEFESYYPKGIFVELKSSSTGAKKKYALVDKKGELKVKGFETVRRNTSVIAREVQRKVLEIVLTGKKEDALTYVREVLADLKAGRVPLSKVIMATQLRKEVASYDSVGPHVAAAKRMADRGREVRPGMLLKFIICKGKGKLRDRVRLVDEAKDYDPEYYINNQVLPSVEKIFAVLGLRVDTISGAQSTLSGF